MRVKCNNFHMSRSNKLSIFPKIVLFSLACHTADTYNAMEYFYQHLHCLIQCLFSFNKHKLLVYEHALFRLLATVFFVIFFMLAHGKQSIYRDTYGGVSSRGPRVRLRICRHTHTIHHQPPAGPDSGTQRQWRSSVGGAPVDQGQGRRRFKGHSQASFFSPHPLLGRPAEASTQSHRTRSSASQRIWRLECRYRDRPTWRSRVPRTRRRSA